MPRKYIHHFIFNLLDKANIKSHNKDIFKVFFDFFGSNVEPESNALVKECIENYSMDLIGLFKTF